MAAEWGDHNPQARETMTALDAKRRGLEQTIVHAISIVRKILLRIKSWEHYLFFVSHYTYPPRSTSFL